MWLAQTQNMDGNIEEYPDKRESDKSQQNVEMKEKALQHTGFENLVDPLELEKAKEQLAKHRAMTYVLKELLFYTLFAGALFVKVFSARADWGFAQSKDILELLRLQVRPSFNLTAHNGTVFEKVSMFSLYLSSQLAKFKEARYIFEYTRSCIMLLINLNFTAEWGCR